MLSSLLQCCSDLSQSHKDSAIWQMLATCGKCWRFRGIRNGTSGTQNEKRRGAIFEQNFFCTFSLSCYLSHKKWELMSKFQFAFYEPPYYTYSLYYRGAFMSVSDSLCQPVISAVLHASLMSFLGGQCFSPQEIIHAVGFNSSWWPEKYKIM